MKYGRRAFSSIFLFSGMVWAQNPSPVSFKKVSLNPEFYSEGIHYGDINRDGVNDIVAGPYWYPGPSFTKKNTFRTPRSTPFDIHGDSDCYTIFVFDLNQDGWPDILSFRLPGGIEAVWYENTKGASGNWIEHVVFSPIQNESAGFVDMNGDGKPEIFTNSNGFGGWAAPDWSNPSKTWAFHPVTSKGPWGTFTHGMGSSDVNGDGRRDLIFSDGWWEQPLPGVTTTWTSHPGSFGGKLNPSEAFGGAQMYAYDVDGDGDNDIVTSLQGHGWGLAWYENKEQGKTFVQHMIMGTRDDYAKYGVAFSQLHAVAIADMDGDGNKDIITGVRKGAHANGLGSEADSAAVLYWFRFTRSASQGVSFQPFLIDRNAGIGTQLIAEDINGDGSPDILTTRREGTYAFLNQNSVPIFPGIQSSKRRSQFLRNSYSQKILFMGKGFSPRDMRGQRLRILDLSH